MYIKKIVYENVGPIENIAVDFPFHEDGNPKPILFVGENGSGKSTVLSNIVDSFYEIAGEAFNNAWQYTGNGAHQYYKAIRAADIHIGQGYMFSYVQFKNENGQEAYLCKDGNISMEMVRNKLENVSLEKLSWTPEESYKGTTANKKSAEQIFENNVICYFGPDRYEKPAWLGYKYYHTDDVPHFSISANWSGNLKNEITVKNVTNTNLRWLLDVIADSRADISNENGLSIAHVGIDNLLLLGSARKNIEKIMSSILGEAVYFSLNFRNTGGSRFRILREKDNTAIAPSLDALSTGQIALFNTFATIIRYADNNDINQSIYLDRITGIVVIDEIELHLHTKLQKEILPKLIKLFPKIQFIITTHAPLFLMGMSEMFGESGFEIYEMPKANRIDVERFSEFRHAYEYFQQTQKYQEDMADTLNLALKKASERTKTLVVTEGHTDWKHMKAAYEKLKLDEQYAELFKDLEFEFLEYEPKNASGKAEHKLEMGNKALETVCESYSKIPQMTRYIFIADRDVEQTNKKLMEDRKHYKNWGNNVYSFIIPLPDNRKDTPAICIEHLYSDEEIKTEYTVPEDGVIRRLYMGNEFDDRGIANTIGKVCEKKNSCGSGKISIIDDNVTNIHDSDGTNYALPKSKFASLILNKEPPFDQFDFKNFVPIFETIKEIISEGKA